MKIAAVVVIYYPHNYVKENIYSLVNQFHEVIVVFNSINNLKLKKNKKLKIINNKNNIGLSKAINMGLFYAMDTKCDFVGLFDQDTLIPETLFKSFCNEVNIFTKKNSLHNLALFSLKHFNLVTNSEQKFTNNNPFLLFRHNAKKNIRYQNLNYAITSGSFIYLKNIKKIGYMDENLFIDFIDIEWCHRAIHKKFKIILLNNIIVNHNLGDNSYKFLNRKFPIHSPLRMYYFYRNFTYLLFQKHINFYWKFFDLFRNILRFLFYIIFITNRIKYARHIFKGVYHGLIHNMGKIKD